MRLILYRRAGLLVSFGRLGVTSWQSAGCPGYSRLGFRLRARHAGRKEKKKPKTSEVAWKTLIAFSLPSVLFVILSPVNFLLFSATPSQLSASCLLGSARLQPSLFSFQGPVFPFFFRSPSLCRRDCGLTEVPFLCCFIHFFHLCIYIFSSPAYFFSATRRYIVNIDF